jgi:hypothetical protein
VLRGDRWSRRNVAALTCCTLELVVVCRGVAAAEPVGVDAEHVCVVVCEKAPQRGGDGDSFLALLCQRALIGRHDDGAVVLRERKGRERRGDLAEQIARRRQVETKGAVVGRHCVNLTALHRGGVDDVARSGRGGEADGDGALEHRNDDVEHERVGARRRLDERRWRTVIRRVWPEQNRRECRGGVMQRGGVGEACETAASASTSATERGAIN